MAFEDSLDGIGDGNPPWSLNGAWGSQIYQLQLGLVASSSLRRMRQQWAACRCRQATNIAWTLDVVVSFESTHWNFTQSVVILGECAESPFGGAASWQGNKDDTNLSCRPELERQRSHLHIL